MKKKNVLGILLTFIAFSCSTDEETNATEEVNVNFRFSHHWDDSEITNTDFNAINYTTANGEEISIERLRYLISDIVFKRLNGESIEINGYLLVDVTNDTGLSFTLSEAIPKGEYTSLSFTFGFDNADNQDGAYADLNTVLWNVPEMLGGGYHYMQLEGKFVDNTTTETGYQYHAIRAVDISRATPVFQDTFFEVDLGSVVVDENSEFEIQMNVAEWFKNPNLWDLNALHSMLMPNFNAQIIISENGRNAFSLGANTN